MKAITPSDLTVFLAIANHLSFSRAAVELGLTPSALSHALRAMETRLDMRLVNRTTRSVALTEAGERLYSRIKPAFRDIDDALEDLNTFRSSPMGNLRLNAGRTAVKLALLPTVLRFMETYPQVNVEIMTDDAFIDVVAQGFDAGVRFGQRIEADMIAAPIGPKMRCAVVATPAFFERHAQPLVPDDLRDLPCIRYRFRSGVHYAWEFERDGVKLQTQVNGSLTLDDMGLIADAVLAGNGLAYVFEDLVQEHIDAGRLIRVLADWCPFEPGLFLYYPSRRQVPFALRSLIEFARLSLDQGNNPAARYISRV